MRDIGFGVIADLDLQAFGGETGGTMAGRVSSARTGATASTSRSRIWPGPSAGSTSTAAPKPRPRPRSRRSVSGSDAANRSGTLPGRCRTGWPNGERPSCGPATAPSRRRTCTPGSHGWPCRAGDRPPGARPGQAFGHHPGALAGGAVGPDGEYSAQRVRGPALSLRGRGDRRPSGREPGCFG